jgi:acyl-CoA thioesterase FadM
VLGHVNNVVYNRFAESARVNWALNFAASDPEHKAEWKELMTPNGIGLILRSIRTDYKFVRSEHLPTMRCCTASDAPH